MRPPPGRLFGWYQLRWIIEQLFRVMKSQGLQLEGSQLVSAERLVKLAAVATKAACLDIQLTQGRDGTDQIPASNAFTEPEIDTLAALGPSLSVFSPDTAPADRCRASPPAPLRRMPRSITQTRRARAVLLLDPPLPLRFAGAGSGEEHSQRSAIRRVAWQHLVGQGKTVRGDHQCDHHLRQSGRLSRLYPRVCSR